MEVTGVIAGGAVGAEGDAGEHADGGSQKPHSSPFC